MKRCAAKPQKKATHPPLEQRSPNTFKATVDFAGLADFVAFMAPKPHFPRMETAAEPQFGGKLPAENLGAYMEISPLNHVDNIVAPLFFAGTTGDKTVPLTLHGGRLVDAMRAQQDNHDLRLRTRRSVYLAEIAPPARWSDGGTGKSS